MEQIPRAHTIYDVAKLQNSYSLKNVMAKIDEFSAVVRKPNELIGTGTLTQFLPFIVQYNVHIFSIFDIFWSGARIRFCCCLDPDALT